MQRADRNSTTRERVRREATEPRPAVGAGASNLWAAAFVGSLITLGTSAAAQDSAGAPSATHDPRYPPERDILGPDHEGGLRVESVMTRVTSFDQYGHGYQSQAGPPGGPGSERATIFEPQLQVVASQGDRLKHIITVPIDVVTAASPDAIDNGPASVDVVSSASRFNVAGTLDWAAIYKLNAVSDLSLDSGLHLEEPFRSWHSALGASRSFADGDTVVSASAVSIFDWFDHFDITGHRHGRANRSTTTGTIGITQIATPTTVLNVNYGLTVQRGELGNTWNSVPLTTLERGAEILPDERARHALVGRMSQFLPWNGALRVYYRFYADDWGLIAHSVEGQLMQRLSPFLYIGALYRFHTQTGADFFTTQAQPTAQWRTADSDLARLRTHTVGGKFVLDLPVEGPFKQLHFELAYERYFRTNDLSMDIVTCATGYRF
jgi:hypothetical protein